MKAPAIQSKESDKLCYLYLIETNKKEIKAFIELWYIQGLLNWTFHDITIMGTRFSMQQCQSNISIFSVQYSI